MPRARLATLIAILLAVSAASAWAQSKEVQVEADDYFVSTNEIVGPDTVILGKMTDKPRVAGGAASFDTRQNEVRTKFYWRFHQAKAEELQPGSVVMVIPHEETRDQVWRTDWRVARVLSLDMLPTVLIDHYDSIDVGRLYIADGLVLPTVAVTSKPDRQHLHDEYWLVSIDDEDLKAGGDLELTPSLALRVPAKPGEEGEFLVAATGKVVKSKHAWRSHPAAPGEIKVGAMVAVAEEDTDNKGPANARAALHLWQECDIVAVDTMDRIFLCNLREASPLKASAIRALVLP